MKSKGKKKTLENESLDNQRRRLLQAAGVGLAAVATMPALLGSSSVRAESVSDNAYDVIVIGGGFAGVTAARDASHRGLRTLLLEARPRLGGRAFTTRFGNHDIDLGGVWFGSSQPFIWSETIRYGLPITESASTRASKAIWMEGDKRIEGSKDTYAGLFEEAADAFYAPARKYLPRPFDPLYAREFGNLDKISAGEAIEGLDISRVQKDLMHSFASINGHSFSNQSSYLDQLRWYALCDYDLWNMLDNISRFRFEGGTKTLIDRMVADSNAEVRLGTPIAQVKQTDDKVTVKTRRGEDIVARTVIVAVPLNCVADIEFVPSISKVKLEASQKRHTGSGTKLYAQIEGKHPLFFGHGKQDMPLNFLFSEYDDPDSQTVVGFGASPSLLDVNDGDAVQAAIARYVPNLTVSESVSYDWNLDPYSKGTWCMYPPGMLTGSLTELQRPEGNVFFAGSDIASGWRGHFDGAIESGGRAAIQVAEHLSSRRT